jgi:hypothetical protein
VALVMTAREVAAAQVAGWVAMTIAPVGYRICFRATQSDPPARSARKRTMRPSRARARQLPRCDSGRVERCVAFAECHIAYASSVEVWCEFIKNFNIKEKVPC